MPDTKAMGKIKHTAVIDGRPYVIDETLPDGRLVLRADTSIETIRKRVRSEPMGSEQVERTFGSLPPDSEG